MNSDSSSSGVPAAAVPVTSPAGLSRRQKKLNWEAAAALNLYEEVPDMTGHRALGCSLSGHRASHRAALCPHVKSRTRQFLPDGRGRGGSGLSKPQAMTKTGGSYS